MKYLINLSGGGDQYYLVVGKATFDWLDSPRPTNFQGFLAEEQVPAAVLAECSKLPTMCEVTTGSCENDRALFLLEGYKPFYSYPKKQGPFEDEWTGCIY